MVQIQTPGEIADFSKTIIGKHNLENILIFSVDNRRQLLFLQILGAEGIDNCAVQDIWRLAMIGNAAGIIIAHNYPSGIIEPTAEDIKVTERLAHAGEILKIPLLDHIIVMGKDFYSFRKRRDDIWK